MRVYPVELNTLEIIDLELLLNMAAKEINEWQRSDNERVRMEGKRLTIVRDQLKDKLRAAMSQVR